jgi:aminoglycoside phosphotransferase (APT) family kinase protein
MKSFPPSTGPVRKGHELDTDALSSYLRAHLPGLSAVHDLVQFEGGQSNPTFFFRDEAGHGYVLRKKPPGALLPSAHLIEREYRVITALGKTAVPVPKTHLLCEDAAVVGTPFFVMDYVPGRIFRDPALPEVDRSVRAAMYDAMNAAAARIHGVDLAEAQLTDYGKPAKYLERQVARWTEQYKAARAQPIDAMDWLSAWLQDHVPPDEPAALTHGDYRLDNLVFHETEPRVVAVLDWELSTLGNALADFAYGCLAYHLPSESKVLRGLAGLNLEALGVPAETDYVAAYMKRTGRPAPDNWSFYIAFGLFRVASIVEGVRARAAKGAASSASGSQVGQMTELLAEIGRAAAKGGR